MYLISVLLFALSANLDNFTVAITFGMRKIKMNYFINFLIAVITGAGTFFSMWIGKMIGRFFPVSVSNTLGSVILILIGLWFLKDFFKKPKEPQQSRQDEKVNLNTMLKDPEKADMDSSGTIDVRESAILALALTINNFGMGVGASISGLNICATTVFTFLISMVSITLGYRVGKGFIPESLCRFVPLISGGIVIALGIFEMLI
ncbi:sporulation membrane protein YtaF [Caproiciproducens sp. AGMB10547]|uniref:Sporulation membrane protein YtaF n=1 Tax=Caproiciproducens faecalis TaxID=2820301 RepID=A0ABS7DRB8_9FIRM|nr:sporulation membrane protein YtaF [Caproiciproducens faecalis]